MLSLIKLALVMMTIAGIGVSGDSMDAYKERDTLVKEAKASRERWSGEKDCDGGGAHGDYPS